MSLYSFLKLKCWLSVFVLVVPSIKSVDKSDHDDSSFPESSDFKTNFYNLKSENAFKNLFPNLDELEPWSLAENLTADFLKHICINILLDVYPSFVPTIKFVREYIPPELGRLQTDRVMRHTPVEFKDVGLKNMTLLRCVFKDFEFFVSQGDDKHVFKLDKDEKNNTYFFMSGPHAINFQDQL